MSTALPSGTDTPAQTRRTQILEAAASVFAQKGYQRATVKEIADVAGVAPGTIYLYFKNKRDLLLTIADHLVGQTMDQTLAQMPQLDAEEYFAAILRSFLDFTQENRALLQAIMTEIWTDRELQEQFFAQVVGPVFETGARYLQDQVSLGRARPCQIEIVVPTITGSLFMLAALRTIAPGRFLTGFTDEALVKELTRLYLYGLTPTPPAATG